MLIQDSLILLIITSILSFLLSLFLSQLKKYREQLPNLKWEEDIYNKRKDLESKSAYITIN